MTPIQVPGLSDFLDAKELQLKVKSQERQIAVLQDRLELLRDANKMAHNVIKNYVVPSPHIKVARAVMERALAILDEVADAHRLDVKDWTPPNNRKRYDMLQEGLENADPKGIEGTGR